MDGINPLFTANTNYGNTSKFTYFLPAKVKLIKFCMTESEPEKLNK